MTTPIRNRVFKVLTVMAMLSMSFIYSCNDTTTKETTTDSTTNSTATPTDSVMQMSPDTTTDTTGKGSQPTPPRD